MHASADAPGFGELLSGSKPEKPDTVKQLERQGFGKVVTQYSDKYVLVPAD